MGKLLIGMNYLKYSVSGAGHERPKLSALSSEPIELVTHA
jgi:hypothetical protein